MSALSETALGTYGDRGNTAAQGSDPLLELIASHDDADYVYDNTNSTHEGVASFSLGDMPSDFKTMRSVKINLRYFWGVGSQVNAWTTLRARIFKSDGTTALTNKTDVASSITTTTPTDSGAVTMLGVDTTATKADWDGALVYIYFNITKSKGGDVIRKCVSAAEVTGSYVVAKDFSDTLALSSLISDPKMNKSVSITDTLALSSLISDAKLFRNFNVTDTLALYSLTSDPSLTLLGGGTVYNIADTLDLSSLTSNPKLTKKINIADAVALSSLVSTSKLTRVTAISDTIPLSSLAGNVRLTLNKNYADTLNLSSLTSTPVMVVSTVKNFSDTLALASLISDPKLFKRVNISDTLALSSLISNAKMFRNINISDALALGSLTSDPIISMRTIFNISDNLALSSLTSNPKLFREIKFSDILDLSSLVSSPDIIISGILNFSDTLALSSLTSNPILTLTPEIIIAIKNQEMNEQGMKKLLQQLYPEIWEYAKWRPGVIKTLLK